MKIRKIALNFNLHFDRPCLCISRVLISSTNNALVIPNIYTLSLLIRGSFFRWCCFFSRFVMDVVFVYNIKKLRCTMATHKYVEQTEEEKKRI